MSTIVLIILLLLFTFRVSRRRREMYCGYARLCVCLSVCLSAAACPHYCTDPDVTWGTGKGCPLVVHCRGDLQSVHGMRCYGNITRTRNVSEYMLVLALCLVLLSLLLFNFVLLLFFNIPVVNIPGAIKTEKTGWSCYTCRSHL